MRFGMTLMRTLLVLSIMGTFMHCSGGSEIQVKPRTPVDDDDDDEEEEPVIPAIAPAVCDFELNEQALVEAGWTKAFEDEFESDFSKWNVWTGGAFNNELQYYSAANMELVDGSLVITSK